MLKQIILGLGLVGIMSLSGCSDTKESLEMESMELKHKCEKLMLEATQEKDKEAFEEIGKECNEKYKDIRKRKKAL
ncbi:MAG: hypothetical protein U9N59_12865 [Campylobacterota bacterium]|nr:hypothetical protein [Campylobacterota bacterium]